MLTPELGRKPCTREELLNDRFFVAENNAGAEVESARSGRVSWFRERSMR
jgi:hypothetical protein